MIYPEQQEMNLENSHPFFFHTFFQTRSQLCTDISLQPRIFSLCIYRNSSKLILRTTESCNNLHAPAKLQGDIENKLLLRIAPFNSKYRCHRRVLEEAREGRQGGEV